MEIEPANVPDGVGEFVLAKASAHESLAASALRWRCDPATLPFRSTAEVEPVNGVVGQDAAIEALRFGLEIQAPGQNIFVRGLVGTGRMTLLRRLLEEVRPSCQHAQDRCYVHNFAAPDRPRLITLPRGRGKLFEQRVDELAEFVRHNLEEALTAAGMPAARTLLDQDTQRKVDAVAKPFEESLRKAGLGLMTLQVGPVSQAALLPLVDGKPVPPDEWAKLRHEGKVSDEDDARFQEQHTAFQGQLRDVTAQVTELRRQHAKAAGTIRDRAIRSIVEELVERLKRDFPDPAVGVFLDELVDDVAGARGQAKEQDEEAKRNYRVNVLIGHTDGTSCAFVVENAPTISNLLGTVDQKWDAAGPGRTDHLMIRAGSLLRADGGYLILEARDLLQEPGSWKVLKRTLRTGRLELVPPEMAGPWWVNALKPEPLEVSVKVILLGDAETYYMLDSHDPDFAYLFKVLADFDSVIRRNEKSVGQYAAVLARIVAEEKLPHFDATAVAALAEHGARIAGSQAKLTARFGRVADIAQEAAFLARKSTHKEVTGEDVRRAVRQTRRRAELPSLRFRELLADGTIRVNLTGKAIGVVNGLAVTHAGPITYGFPARLTATIGPGSAGVINIERESDLSGSVHTKGFYILGGLLRHLLRTEHPLTFHASIAFEQSYGGIDGDSASGAEICCLLSALTGVPLRQDLAMTGAIDQVGHILAVGATNEKLEGFFDTCGDSGLTGTQGVIIPKSNAGDLMLRPDVVEACEAGQFHIYAVDTVHEALELLTGIKAGQRDDHGTYSEDTLLGLAVVKAFEYWVKAAQGVDAFLQVEEEAPAPSPPTGE